VKQRPQPDQVKVEKKFSDLDSLADSCFELGAAVEFCTPILEQITYGSTLKSSFKHISQELKCHYNNSTGLHVHVGCGKGSSWSLEELKAIGKATILWESKYLFIATLLNVIANFFHSRHRPDARTPPRKGKLDDRLQQVESSSGGPHTGRGFQEDRQVSHCRGVLRADWNGEVLQVQLHCELEVRNNRVSAGGGLWRWSKGCGLGCKFFFPSSLV